MTDLSRVLPDFPAGRFASLLPAIERHGLTTADLLTLQVPDIGKRTRLPLLDVKRLCNAVVDALHVDLGVSGNQQQQQQQQKPTGGDRKSEPRDGESKSAPSAAPAPTPLKRTGAELLAAPRRFISTLDDALDAALGGGAPVGSVTEIVGESGAGKTQLLLTLLLAAQLPPPRGLGRPAVYVSTEAPLSTRRLSQLLSRHPALRDLPPSSSDRPSLDRVVGTVTPDLESQDHILSFQVPVEVARRGAGLLVLDSVAANYRAEFERGGGTGGANNLAARGHELARLGRMLHELARTHDLAVVVANQVADRFVGGRPPGKNGPLLLPPPSYSLPRVSQESPLAARTSRCVAGDAVPPSSGNGSGSGTPAEYPLRSSMPEPPPEEPAAPAALLLDHQQRWFTGWGDDYDHNASRQDLKTPSLGLVWTTQVAARVALLKRPAYGPKKLVAEDEDDGTVAVRTWRRWMKVVFAPHVAGAGPGLDGAVEFEITMGGLRSVDGKEKKAKARGDNNGGDGDT
ncbi:DNA repair protein RAD57 [Hypoxylon sp. FL1284]|nr:DNA repair protein RAD57 [Hypoxylon sp. FL1284]